MRKRRYQQGKRGERECREQRPTKVHAASSSSGRAAWEPGSPAEAVPPRAAGAHR